MECGKCIELVARTLREIGVCAHDGLLLGVSGGPDSVALLHMLREIGVYKLYVAHLNHGIRGAQADLDAAFVRELSHTLGLPYFEERADVPAFARAQDMTLEEAARSARYDFLNRVKAQCGARFLVTAHHMNDQAETVLMHLLRGSALNGLCGMRMQNGELIRPMLRLTRSDIMEYISHAGLAYRTDETNLLPGCTRNRIRLSLIPELCQYNPSIIEGLSRMAELLDLDEQYLLTRAQNALLSADLGNGKYDRRRLFALEPPIKSRAVRLALHSMHIPCERHNVDRVLALLDAHTGMRVSLPGGMAAYTSYEALVIAKEQPPPAYFEAQLRIPGETMTPHGCFYASWAEALRTDEGAFVAYMDADTLPENITVRTRMAADRFHPLGAPGARNLKRYLIDKKIPQAKRDTPLLAQDSTVLFFPGGTIAHALRVTTNTARILHVEYIPGTTNTND